MGEAIKAIPEHGINAKLKFEVFESNDNKTSMDSTENSETNKSVTSLVDEHIDKRLHDLEVSVLQHVERVKVEVVQRLGRQLLTPLSVTPPSPDSILTPCFEEGTNSVNTQLNGHIASLEIPRQRFKEHVNKIK